MVLGWLDKGWEGEEWGGKGKGKLDRGMVGKGLSKERKKWEGRRVAKGGKDSRQILRYLLKNVDD